MTIEEMSEVITAFALRSELHWYHAGDKFGIEQHVVEYIYLHLDDEETDSELESGGMLDV